MKLLSLYPAPTTSGKLANNFLNNPKPNTTINAFDLRIDETFGSRDTLFGVWDESYYTAFAPGALPGQNDQNDAFPSYAFAAGYTHIFTPTLSNELHVGFGHSDKDQRLTTESFDYVSDGKRHWLRVNIRSAEGSLLILGNPVSLNL